MKLVIGDWFMVHRQEKGVAPIVVIGIVLAVLLVATLVLSLGGLKSTSNLPSFSSTNSKTEKTENCQNSDYGGCDSEKNFYEWKDDGKRK